MFKSLDNNNSIPNNYVYTSNKGTEYTYHDGSWLNCETMSTVHSTHNFKMNQSALRQIAEHNERNSLKIGKTYVIKESKYTYVGRNNFTLNGSLLSESINSRVKMIVEADNKSQFSNIKLGSTENIEIPDKFKLDGFVYNKEKNAWWGTDTNENGNQYTGYIKDKSLVSELQNDAIERIKQYNKTDPYPVGTTVDYDGNTVTWNGDVWMVPGKGAYPSGFTQQFDSYYEENKNSLNSSETSQDDQSSNDNNSSDEQKPVDSNNDTTQNSGSSDVPNGYVYTSNKGNSYYKKNGQWFNSNTKKPINSSSVQMLERSAKAQIDKHNSTSPIKIGSEFKSKSGITYKYAGGNRFISDDGKLLPIATAQKVIDNLSSKTDDSTEQEPQDASVDNQTDTPNTDVPNTETPAPTQNNNSGTPPANDQNTNGLEGLANQIKSNPQAPRIIVLLTRGDDLSLLAADILLSGQQKEVAQILNSLNNEE